MPQILIEPQNPLDLTIVQLEDLAQSIREIDPSYDVRFAYRKQKGYGVTWWEVLYIWLPWIGTAVGAIAVEKAVEKIIDLSIDWFRRRFNKEGKWKRPKYVAILGPDGKVLKSVRVNDEAQEPEDLTEEDQQKPPRSLPPIR